MKILIADKIENEGIRYLQEKGAEIKVEKLSPAELREKIKDFDAVIVRSATKITREIIAAGKPRLKVIGRAGVGVDNIDIEAATENGVLVVNAPYSNTVTTAELTIAHILSMSRKIPQAYKSMKEGKWEKKKFMGTELRGKTIGIIGLGRIGSYVAQLANGLGMKVVAYDPFANPKKEHHYIQIVTELHDLLKISDIITIHIPLNEHTYHFIGKKEILDMKDGVMLVNCARGGIIDEQALIEAIKEGKVSSVSLDVFEEEPPQLNELLLHPDVITTPHIGASTIEAQKKVAVEVAEYVWSALNGYPPRSAINFPVPMEDFDYLKEFASLTETIGKFVYQLSLHNLKKIEFIYSGTVAEYNTKILTASFLKGLLSPILEENINQINSMIVARERGINIIETKISEEKKLRPEIYIKLPEENVLYSIGGTITPDGEKLISSINEYRIEIRPHGYLLITKHKDTPGIVGKVGTILGDNNINIANMQLAREKPREEAIMLLSVDEKITDEILVKIKEVTGINHVWFVNP